MLMLNMFVAKVTISVNLCSNAEYNYNCTFNASVSVCKDHIVIIGLYFMSEWTPSSSATVERFYCKRVSVQQQ